MKQRERVRGEAAPAPALERTALKEWAVIVAALARGDFAAMVRKGGIREQRAGFGVRHDRFLLYPTWFHEKHEELVPALQEELPESLSARPDNGMLTFNWLAHVAALWRVTDLERLRGIEGEHGLSWAAVQSRFNYRDNPVVHIVAVDLHELPQPVSLPEARRYQGCVSWVELDADVDVSEARPVHPPDFIAERVERLRATLGEPLQVAARGTG